MAGRLLRGLAAMLYCNKVGGLTTVHVPRVDNAMVDVVSRPAKAQKMSCAATPLSDTDFCLSFDTTFLLLKGQDWMLEEVPPWLKLCVFETLRGKQLALQQWTGPNAIITRERGQRTANSTPRNLASDSQQVRQQTDYSRLLSPCKKASTVLEVKSKFSQLSGLSGMLPKGLFWTDTLTQDKPLQHSMPSTSQ